MGDFVRNSIKEPTAPFELVPGKDPSDWAFSIEPYLWAMGLSGTTGVGNLPAIKVNASTQRLLQNLDWGLMAFGEVRKGRWGLLADGYYAKLSGSRSLGGVFYESGSLNIEQGLASLALAYRIIDDRRGFFDVYGGARYNYFGAQLGLDLNDARRVLGRDLFGGLGGVLRTEASLTEWWVDPIIGMRAQVNFTRSLYLASQADVGGLGAGSQIAWNVMTSLGVNFTRNVYAEVGYRYMYVDYNKSGFLYDMNTYGLISSIGFKF